MRGLLIYSEVTPSFFTWSYKRFCYALRTNFIDVYWYYYGSKGNTVSPPAPPPRKGQQGELFSWLRYPWEFECGSSQPKRRVANYFTFIKRPTSLEVFALVCYGPAWLRNTSVLNLESIKLKLPTQFMHFKSNFKPKSRCVWS